MHNHARQTMLALFLSGMMAVHIGLAIEGWPMISAGSPDFTIVYSAAKLIAQGNGHQLYDQAAETRIQSEVAPNARHRRAAIPYMHAPFEALLFVPLTLLPLTPAYFVWNGLNVIFLVMFAILIRRHLPVLSQSSLALSLLFLGGFFPVFNTLLEGQDVVLLLLLYGLAFVAIRRQEWCRAGVWLGLGCFRPHLVLPFLLFVTLLSRWKFVLGFVTSAAALTMISAAVVGPRGVLDYPRTLWSLEHSIGPLILPGRDNPNLRGLVEGLLSGWVSQKVIVGMVIGTSAVAIILVVKFLNKAGQERIDLQFCLALVATVLISYHTLFYDYTLLALVILVMWNYAMSREEGARRVELLAPAAILTFTPIYILFWIHRWEGSYLMSVVLLAWAPLLMREISRGAVIVPTPGRRQGTP